MYKTKDELIQILGQITKNIIPVIPFPIRVQVYPNSVFIEIIIGEEYKDNSDKNDSICFGFTCKNCIYGYAIYPELVEYEDYEGNDYSVEALTEYTINMINKCTANYKIIV